MTPSGQGSFRLFQFAGINVFLHWSWFLIAVIAVQARAGLYHSGIWNVLEYLALFLIVLTHEFGHALACRQVGGEANRIVLWPLGGVAYVNPPQRAGATLWSIAAGPLVNVALIPVLGGLWLLSGWLGWTSSMPDLHEFLKAVALINLLLLIFNMLPIYPLDGGQILRSLLWFVMGRARSLLVATVVGFIGVAGLMGLALWGRSIWLGVMAAFILLNCWKGMQHAIALLRLSKAPHHRHLRCPKCEEAPPAGAYWICGECQTRFDIFQNHARCPGCGAQFVEVGCLACGHLAPMDQWAGRDW